jgi:glycosyltransferase involved in cell wall biosynthesis
VTERPILQVISSTDRRGAEIFGVELGEALSRRGHTVHTVALARGRSGGLEVETLGPSRFAPRTLRALRRAAREATLVAAHGSSTLPAVAVALAGTGRPFVYRNIGDPRYWTTSAAGRTRVRLLLGRAGAVVALSEQAAVEIVDRYGVTRERVTVIPRGVPAARCPPADPPRRARARAKLRVNEAAKTIAVIGALSPEKDVALAIDAVTAMSDVQLVVAGDGPDRAELETRAAVSTPGRVHFTGSLVDPGPVYDAADVVVLTSLTEGLPGVAIEAGLRGLPVVATDVGFVGDVVVDGETGVLVCPGDREGLVRAIGRAFANANALGGAARARCLARFELEPIADRWAHLLEEISRRHGGESP